MRFVGEMIRAVEYDVTPNDMYSEAAAFGLNVDMCRWIASFLLNTGLIKEPRYGSLRATPRGIALAAQLPLAEAPHAAPEPEGRAQESLRRSRTWRGSRGSPRPEVTCLAGLSSKVSVTPSSRWDSKPG
jgi:hypothetical protein